MSRYRTSYRSSSVGNLKSFFVFAGSALSECHSFLFTKCILVAAHLASLKIELVRNLCDIARCQLCQCIEFPKGKEQTDAANCKLQT